MTAEQQAALKERMRAIVANTSWDKTAEKMHHLIQTTEPDNKAARLLNPALDSADLDEVDADNVDALRIHPAAASRAAGHDGRVQAAG